MKKIVASSSEHVVIEHSPEVYELVDADYEDFPRIGIFFTGEDAPKLLARLSAPLGPRESDRSRLRVIRRPDLRNIGQGRPKL